MATFEELIQQLIDHSNLIGTETKIGQNTNIRVGNLGHKVVELLSHIGNVNEKFLSRLTQDTAQELITFAMGLTAEDLSVFEKGIKSSFVLIEDESTQSIAQGVTESGDEPEESGTVAQMLTERFASTGGATTFGELLNVDDSFDTVNDGVYSLKKQNGNFYPIVGGGGGSTSRMTLIHKTGAVATVAYGRDYFIEFTFTSTVSGSDTGPGVVEYKVNNKLVGGGVLQQGDTTFNVGPYLLPGDNTLTVKVTDSYGTSRTITFGISTVIVQLTSTFDATQIYQGVVLFKFTPTGFGTMNIHILVDDLEVGLVTTTQSNRQLTYNIPALTHGAHLIRAFMTLDIDGASITSNELLYSIICVQAGNNTPIISSTFNQSEATQFDLVNIPYMVYDPTSLTAEIEYHVNGEKISDLVVDRKLQRWSYNFTQPGPHILMIRCGTVTKLFNIDVSESDISSIEETEGLQLKLLSYGRSNAESDRDRWQYGDISSVFSNFNFVSDGWTIDENGGTFLKVVGDAQLTIPFKIFGTDFKQNGKTIEFAFFTENVTDLDYVVLSCMSGNRGFEITPQNAIFKSEQSTITTQFKENEFVRISISIQQTAKQRLISLFINGILSGVTQYPASDSFLQLNPVNITVSGKKATIGLYAVRVYSTDLESWQVLNNHIFDFPDFSGKAFLFGRNRILGADSHISYNALVEQLPCMVVTGDLPTYKGDKKTCAVSFEDRKNPERSFRATNVQNDVQGTSSQYYPRKNFKMKFRDGFEMTLSGTHEDGFKTHPHTLPATVFTHKADFAEASGTHNTGVAKVVENLLKALNIKTPPQLIDDRVRTTVDGFAMAIFHRPDENSPATFIGKYNFNTDKAAENTFGFTSPAECWEVLNNTSDRVLFKSSEYASGEWLNDFEGRFPDGNEDYTNLKRMTDWVVSCIGNPAKFRTELPGYFHQDFLISYFVITELLAMVDQRAKNCFWTTFDTQIWLPIFYDNDTCLGINNEGVNVFSFDVETGDRIGTKSVWNADDSELWKLVSQAFPNEIKAMYQRIRKDNTLSYDSVLSILNGEHSDLWAETVYNEDGQFKYIDPLLEDGNGAYLYAAQGSRSEHRKWWLFNRFRYMDSRFDTGDFKDDFLTMRLYTPSGDLAVTPDADFTIEPFASQYIQAKWGSYISHRRVRQGEITTFQAPAIVFNDTETIIYGASYIRSIGDLSGKYAGTIDVSKATKLTELLIGSGVDGYQNTNLQTLHVGNNKMLRKIDVRNCPNLKQPLDLSGCDNIEEIYAQGTGITGVELRDGGIVKRLHLPASVTNLRLVSQKELTFSFLTFEDASNLVSLRIEGCPNINGYELSKLTGSLQILRLIGINATDVDLQHLSSLARMKGIDENGFVINTAVITGQIHVTTAHESLLAAVQAAFPNLTITYNNYVLDPTRTITIKRAANNSNLVGVDISVNGVVYTTNAQGQVVLKTSEALNIVVNVEGYKAQTAIVSASSSNTSTTISLNNFVVLTLTVKNSIGWYLNNARVLFDGEEYFTNQNGVVQITAVKGSYETTIYHKNTSKTQSIVVNYVDLSVTVTFTASVEDILLSMKPETNGNILLTVFTVDNTEAGRTVAFSAINASGAIVNWGDGSSDTILSETVSHTYTDLDFYNIEVSGCQNITKFEEGNRGQKQRTVAYWSIGDSKISNMNFNFRYLGSFSSLVIVGSDIFKNDTQRTSFQYCFYSCRKLANIPSDLFENCTEVTNFSECFVECYALSIPSGLFDNCTKVTSFSRCFQDTNFSSIPQGLFDYCTEVTDFFGCFMYSRLIAAPKGLFDNCTKVTSFSSCFYQSSSLKYLEIPQFLPTSSKSSMLLYVSSLVAVVSKAEIPVSIPSGLFSSSESGSFKIYVPDASVDAYKAATNWSAYASRIYPLSQIPPEYA